jgi:ribosomal protein S2
LSQICSQVNTAVHQPTVLYPIPCNDASGASFNLLLGAMQGMMLRVDQLQKKRLLMMILMEATMKNQVAQELQRRKEAFDEDWDEDDEEEARRKARRGAPGAGRGRGGANRKL